MPDRAFSIKRERSLAVVDEERAHTSPVTERRRDAENTMAPARNFTVSVADRVRAAYGPPAYAVRRRRIEDLEAKIVAELRALIAAHPDPRALDVEVRRSDLARAIAQLNRLVDAHNECYPCEANLPLDPRTGEMLERGTPWRPMLRFTLDALIASAQ
jgi:hypothetical protein